MRSIYFFILLLCLSSSFNHKVYSSINDELSDRDDSASSAHSSLNSINSCLSDVEIDSNGHVQSVSKMTVKNNTVDDLQANSSYSDSTTCSLNQPRACQQKVTFKDKLKRQFFNEEDELQIYLNLIREKEVNNNDLIEIYKFFTSMLKDESLSKAKRARLLDLKHQIEQFIPHKLPKQANLTGRDIRSRQHELKSLIKSDTEKTLSRFSPKRYRNIPTHRQRKNLIGEAKQNDLLMHHRFTKDSNVKYAGAQLTLENSLINEAEVIREYQEEINRLNQQAVQIEAYRKENERLKAQLDQ